VSGTHAVAIATIGLYLGLAIVEFFILHHVRPIGTAAEAEPTPTSQRTELATAST
jgi:hypothetical protein